QAYRVGSWEVVCGRAHRIRSAPDGTPLPYCAWESEIPAVPGSRLVFPTGIGGALYRADTFRPTWNVQFRTLFSANGTGPPAENTDERASGAPGCAWHCAFLSR